MDEAGLERLLPKGGQIEGGNGQLGGHILAAVVSDAAPRGGIEGPKGGVALPADILELRPEPAQFALLSALGYRSPAPDLRQIETVTEVGRDKLPNACHPNRSAAEWRWSPDGVWGRCWKTGNGTAKGTKHTKEKSPGTTGFLPDRPIESHSPAG